MSGLRTNAAAAMLGVSPNTLRSWERRYGFPRPRRTPGGHRQYELGEVESLRATLAETRDVTSAIALVKERGDGPPSGSRLADAFAQFDEVRCNALLEESLALRSVERTVEEVLLKGVAAHAGSCTPEYEFGARFAADWMSAFRRLAPLPTRSTGVLVLDACAPRELDALYAQALELVLRRAGLRTLVLSSAIEPPRLVRALQALHPRAVVLVGRIPLEALGRLVYSVRTLNRDAAIYGYRGAVTDSNTGAVRRLDDTPLAARDALLARLEAPGPALRAAAG